MKRLLICLMVLCCLCGLACAEDEVDASALWVMQANHPDYSVLDADQWGNTAAAVLERDNARILCVAERENDAWVLTIDNPNALPAGKEISILMDADNALFWGIPYGGVRPGKLQYSCFKENGTWGQVQCTDIYGEQTIFELFTLWENGMLREIEEQHDENGNLLERREQCAAIPARWMEESLLLANYNDAIAPVPDSSPFRTSWLSDEVLRRCAEEIVPGYTFLEGAALYDGLELLMRDPDGILRMVACSCVNGGPVVNISSPLPEGTKHGDENDSSCLRLPQDTLARIAACADGGWYVSSAYPRQDAGQVWIGRNWISERPNFFMTALFYVGDHPWSDITTADWTAIPTSLEEALEQLDPSRWAVVNNPNPADRLHLREKAERGSRSFGKYYNGTPVEVLEKGKTWTRVRIQGINGWMMTQYLAFGKDAWQVEDAFPDLHYVENTSSFPVWTEDNVIRGRKLTADGDWTVEKGEHVCIIGILGEEWYHVWFPDLDTGGMMRQSDFWPGNG